jgi:hypothetical protein
MAISTSVRSSTARTLLQAATEYLTCADMYTSESDIDKVRCIFESYKEVFVKDHIYDWIEMTLKHFPKNIIKKLAHVYQVLDIHEIARRVGWEDDTASQRELMELIEQRSISATIDTEHQTITFTDDHEATGQYTCTIEILRNQLHNIMDRTRTLKTQLHAHPMYIEKMKAIQGDSVSHQEESSEDDIAMEDE